MDINIPEALNSLKGIAIPTEVAAKVTKKANLAGGVLGLIGMVLGSITEFEVNDFFEAVRDILVAIAEENIELVERIIPGVIEIDQSDGGKFIKTVRLFGVLIGALGEDPEQTKKLFAEIYAKLLTLEDTALGKKIAGTIKNLHTMAHAA
jgi:hypothetical protein